METMKSLEKLNVLTYIPLRQNPQIIFCEERLDAKTLVISKENYHDRKKIAEEKLNAVIHYISSKLKCRSQILLKYFGEEDPQRCGQCDVCLERNKLGLSEMDFDKVVEQLKPLLMNETKTMDETIQAIKHVGDDSAIKVIQWFIDNDKIGQNENGELFWKKRK